MDYIRWIRFGRINLSKIGKESHKFVPNLLSKIPHEYDLTYTYIDLDMDE